jgi:hypothetical protein
LILWWWRVDLNHLPWGYEASNAYSARQQCAQTALNALFGPHGACKYIQALRPRDVV